MTNITVPRIVSTLLADEGKRIHQYFQRPKDTNLDERIWGKNSKGDEERVRRRILDFGKKANSKVLYHDEPWLTLVGLYGLFGDQTDLNNPRRREALNRLFSEVFDSHQGKSAPPQFDGLIGAHLEVYLPENRKFREYVRNTIFKDGPYHLYPDRKQVLANKLQKETASLEGNTNLDALISGWKGDVKIHVFIEAKFLSDISTYISYVPVRNQIARNIDCAIDVMTGGGQHLEGLNDFWFVLLTPGIFRTDKYGGSVESPVDSFVPEQSRLYCYKMDDYLDSALLKRDLPHWEGVLDNTHWELLSSHIGWMTFEGIVQEVEFSGTLTGKSLEDFMAFFAERSLLPEYDRVMGYDTYRNHIKS